mgnify:CR=1 FL=1
MKKQEQRQQENNGFTLTCKECYNTFLETFDGYYGTEALNRLFPKEVDAEGLGKILAEASSVVAPNEHRRLFQEVAVGKYSNGNAAINVILEQSPLKKPYVGVYLQ